MKRKFLWCGLSFLLVASLMLTSCGEAAPGEQEEEEEEVLPAVGEQEEEEVVEEEEELIVEDIVTIGQWVDEAWPGGAIITMTHENESIIVDTEFNDGSRHREEMVEETVAGQQRFYVKGGSTFNDYYVINTKGDLDIYDDVGYIRTAYLEDGVVITATPGEQEEEEPEPEPMPDREAMIEIFKDNASATWGNDYQMVKYEVDNQTEAYDWVVEQTAYLDIMEKSEDKWYPDYEMVKYEYENQVEAYEWIKRQTAHPDIMEEAKRKWGDDYEMVKYEYENQVEAYEALQ